MDFFPAPTPAELEQFYRRSGYQVDVTLPALMTRNRDEFGDLVAVIDGDVELTWRQLIDQAARFAGFLQANGVGAGDVVVWQLPNWWESLVVAYGIWAVGAVSSPVVPIYRSFELRNVIGAGVDVLRRHADGVPRPRRPRRRRRAGARGLDVGHDLGGQGRRPQHAQLRRLAAADVALAGQPVGRPVVHAGAHHPCHRTAVVHRRPVVHRLVDRHPRRLGRRPRDRRHRPLRGDDVGGGGGGHGRAAGGARGEGPARAAAALGLPVRWLHHPHRAGRAL